MQKSVPNPVLKGVRRKFGSIWRRYSNFIYLPGIIYMERKTQTLLRNTLPEIMLTVYQVFPQIRLHSVIAQL